MSPELEDDALADAFATAVLAGAPIDRDPWRAYCDLDPWRQRLVVERACRYAAFRYELSRRNEPARSSRQADRTASSGARAEPCRGLSSGSAISNSDIARHDAADAPDRPRPLPTAPALPFLEIGSQVTEPVAVAAVFPPSAAAAEQFSGGAA